MTITTNLGKIVISKDKKNPDNLYYKFIPTESFDKQAKQAIEQIETFEKQLEESVNKKLNSIYTVN